MATIHVCAERTVEASAETVYGYLADMREHHPRFLPRAFSEFEVESAGVGHGTITRFRLTAGGGTREYRMEVAESQPGRVLTKSDTNSSLVTTGYRHPHGAASRVQISTTWQGAAGIGGSSSGCVLRRSCAASTLQELERLNTYARQRASSGSGS